jgi:two-component system response regulator PilR (NtrC family)
MTDAETITSAELPPHIINCNADFTPTNNGEIAKAQPTLPEDGIKFDQYVAQFEYDLLRIAIERSGGIKTRAAELLRLNKDKMKYLCRKYGL